MDTTKTKSSEIDLALSIKETAPNNFVKISLMIFG